MSATDIAGTTVIVTGASRGFGRAVAAAFVAAGARVVAVARDGEALEKLHGELGDDFVPVAGDATGAELAARLIEEYQPRTLVLNAGASPVMLPIRDHTWESFRNNWEVDVQHEFHWVRAALRQPLAPGSSVLSISSGAALRGSPLSGGYAGAKATVRFISDYAAAESEGQGLDLRFVSVLPVLTPETDLGASGVAAYAALQGVDVPTYVSGLGQVLTPEKVGEALVSLAADADQLHPAYLLTSSGLNPV